MHIREATIHDIPELQVIRHAVKENVLSDPSLVPDAEYARFFNKDGKGWVCEFDNIITGFAIIDNSKHNIWALFVRPEYENKGIGRRLHDIMLQSHFGQSQETVWLGTSPATRAETFYRLQGWKDSGKLGENEIRFEMSYEDWKKKLKGK